MLKQVLIVSLCYTVTTVDGAGGQGYQCGNLLDSILHRLDVLENQTARLQDTDAQQRDQLASLEEQVRQLKNQTTLLQDSDSQQAKRLATLESRVSQLQAADSLQQTQLSALERRLSAAENQSSQLQRQVSQLQGSNSQHQTQLSKLVAHSQQHVAFSARFIGFENNLYIGTSPIRFTTIITNVGNGYNPSTGYFTAPVAGDYLFSFHMRSTNRYAYIVVGIYKNNEELFVATAEGSGDLWDRGSTLVTASLAAGDQVYCKFSSGNAWLEGGALTQFSGALLHPHTSF